MPMKNKMVVNLPKEIWEELQKVEGTTMWKKINKLLHIYWQNNKLGDAYIEQKVLEKVQDIWNKKYEVYMMRKMEQLESNNELIERRLDDIEGQMKERVDRFIDAISKRIKD